MIRQSSLGEHIATFSGTFRSVRSLSVLMGVLLLVIVVTTGASKGDWENVRTSLPVIFLVWVACVGLFRLTAHFMRVHVFSHGIQGRSFGGFRREFRWEHITAIRNDGAGGMAAAVLIEEPTGKELWMLREIATRQDFQLAIQPYLDWNKLATNNS